jgi:hypothetical protein
MEDLDDNIKKLIAELNESGYQRALIPMRDSKYSYWKMFYNESHDKIYQIGYLFVNNFNYGMINTVPEFTFTQECHLIGDYNIFLSNNRPLTVYGFEEMALDFYNGVGKYMI